MQVCVIGHVTKDLIRIPGKADREMAGGSALYVSATLRCLGYDVEVVTKVAPDDEHLLEPLRSRGVRVLNGFTPTTTTFENVYLDAGLTKREQWVRSVAAPFSPDDLADVRSSAFHLGPLTSEEVSLDTLRAVRARATTMICDLQGMLRRVEHGKVHLATWNQMAEGLPLCDMVKVDDLEAEQLVGTRDPALAAEALGALGASEVLVTRADRGSWVRADGMSTAIPAIPPRQLVDATGCGDTYAGGYFAARLRGDDPYRAAYLAAATASLKLESYGPFNGVWREVEQALARRIDS